MPPLVSPAVEIFSKHSQDLLSYPTPPFPHAGPKQFLWAQFVCPGFADSLYQTCWSFVLYPSLMGFQAQMDWHCLATGLETIKSNYSVGLHILFTPFLGILLLDSLYHLGAHVQCMAVEPKTLWKRWTACSSGKLLFSSCANFIESRYSGMSCPSWQWHRTGSSWSPVQTLPVAPLWCDLGFILNSSGNKAAVKLCPIQNFTDHQLDAANTSIGSDQLTPGWPKSSRQKCFLPLTSFNCLIIFESLLIYFVYNSSTGNCSGSLVFQILH